MLTGMTIFEVLPGTVITNPLTGEELTVTETQAVVLYDKMYLTAKHFAAVRSQGTPPDATRPI